MTINQRIKFLIDSKGFNKNSFSEHINVLPQTMHNIVDGRMNEPSFKVIQKILSAFVDINPLWLINGIGEVFLKNEQSSIIAEPIEKYSLSSDFDSLSEGKSISKSISNSISNSEFASMAAVNPVIVTVNELGHENIVLVDAKAAAGYVNNRLETTFMRDLPAFSLPGGLYRNATYRAFEVERDSMYDTIYPGDLAISKLCTGHVNDIKDGYVHVIVTQSDIVIKRCINRVKERGKIVCMSDNEAYPPFELDIQDIKEVWFVHKLITGHLPARNRDLKLLVSRLESDMIDLKNRQDKLDAFYRQNRSE